MQSENECVWDAHNLENVDFFPSFCIVFKECLECVFVKTEY